MSSLPAPAADPVEFKRELTGVVPHLRAFARGLCGRPDMADDLVQETLMKAWAAQERFQPGTSMRAWTFVILRNAYLTDMRRNRFRGEYDETVAERVLTAPAGQEEPIHLSDMHRALLTLPPERREALLHAIGAAASVGSAIGACRMPRHADEERAVMAVICRPPWLAVGHQRVEILFQRLVIERIEGLGIIEIIAHRV